MDMMSHGSIQLADERPRVLIVDNEKFIRDILADFFGMEGYTVCTASDGISAISELGEASYDLVLSDLKMPHMGGMELLEHIHRTNPQVVTVMMTGFGTVETAIDAMKKGAYDYVLKPFKVEDVMRVVERGLKKQRIATESLRLKESLSLYKVSEAIQASLSLEEVLMNLVDSALYEVGGDFVSTWLSDGQGNFFERQRMARIHATKQSNHGLSISTHIEPRRPLSAPPSERDVTSHGSASSDEGELEPQAFVEHFGHSSVLLIQREAGLRFFKVAPKKELYSLLAVPLRMKDRLLGFSAVFSFQRNHRFDEGKRKLFAMIGSRAASAIENARLYEDLQATFQQTIQGLAKAIDKIDQYTAGHSDRVSVYSSFIATKIGLPSFEIEVVRQSALMHDVGKIGCVKNLNKVGKLSREEYEDFKKHPTFGREILEPIKFLHPLLPGVYSHHERWDGRGYPRGLEKEAIPLLARIVSVADTYDAMTSDRAYRPALSHEVAVEEIERCSGTQFDPGVASKFAENIESYREEQVALGNEVVP